MIDKFTSTGKKLLFHVDTLATFFEEKHLATPITIQLAPTSRCNLNCEFCSNRNREKDQDLNIERIMELFSKLDYFIQLPASVELTGGGDPTLYPKINELIHWLGEESIKIGFITNGVALHNLDQRSLDSLSWLRVSLNSLDYVKDITIPKIKGTLGFSYVLDIKKKFVDPVKERLDEYVKRYNPEYVRIVPNCQNSYEDQIKANKTLSALISTWGHPYFYQTKEFRKPDKCLWCYFKPFILHDGWVYPCSSVVLNSNSGEKFHEKYRWCEIEDLSDKYDTSVVPFDSSNCDHCVFYNQNETLSYLLKDHGDHIYFV